jgi:hypothetical protein
MHDLILVLTHSIVYENSKINFTVVIDYFALLNISC